jgi:hypothetical protein
LPLAWRDHVGVLAHAEIVVGTPHGDFAGRAVRLVARRLGELAHPPLKLGKHPVVAGIVQAIKLFGEESGVIHYKLDPVFYLGSVQFRLRLG